MRTPRLPARQAQFVAIGTASARTPQLDSPPAQHQRARHVAGAHCLPMLLMRIALTTQRRPLRFQFILHEAEPRQDDAIPQRRAREPAKRKPHLSRCALLFVPLLASLSHGGFPPYSNPIFRSAEVCRHSKINNPQDISPRFYVQTQDLIGGGHGLLITLLSAEPITMLRFVINNRLRVAGCDSHQPRYMRQGDQFRIVIPPACGNYVQIDLYTNRGAVNYTIDRPD